MLRTTGRRTGGVGLFIGLLAAAASPGALRAQPSVFAPGAVSKAGENVYRGQFSGDGREFWFFRKVAAAGEEYRIYVARRTGDTWSEPERVRFGMDASDLYPAVSPDGRTLVFTSYRPFPGDTSARPNANLWYVERRGDGWGEPVPMRGASTAANYDSGPWFDGEGALHYHSTEPDWRTRHARMVQAGADLSAAAPIHDALTDPWATWRPDLYVWGGTPSPGGELMILDVSPVGADGRRGPPDLWLSRRGADGWSEPVLLGSAINRPDSAENFVTFTPDGRTMLFVRDFSVYLAVRVRELVEGR